MVKDNFTHFRRGEIKGLARKERCSTKLVTQKETCEILNADERFIVTRNLKKASGRVHVSFKIITLPINSYIQSLEIGYN